MLGSAEFASAGAEEPSLKCRCGAAGAVLRGVKLLRWENDWRLKTGAQNGGKMSGKQQYSFEGITGF